MFGRRAPRQVARLELEQEGAAAITSHYGVPAGVQTPQLYQTGWRAFGHGQHASDQIGAYAGTVLTGYPSIIPGPQLSNGVCALQNGWYYPQVSVVPNGSVQQTNPAAYLPGAQRHGSKFGGPIGPLSVRKMRARIAAASVDQTSLAAQPWAGIVQPIE